MIGFTQVDPGDLDKEPVEGGRGRPSTISASLISKFMDANIKLAEITETDYEGTVYNLLSVLSNYLKKRKLPVKAFVRVKKIYLMRTDLDDNNEPIR